MEKFITKSEDRLDLKAKERTEDFTNGDCSERVKQGFSIFHWLEGK